MANGVWGARGVYKYKSNHKATTSRETHAPKNAHYKKAEGSKHRALGPLNPEPKFEV